MSTTASRVIELVKSLPEADQEAIRTALAEQVAPLPAASRRTLSRLSDGSFLNPNGIPNDDPVFSVLEEIEEQRHRTPGPESQVVA